MLTRLLKCFMFVFVVIFNFNYHKVYAQNSCTTLRGETGICVPILTCTTMTQLLKAAPRPIPRSVQELVRRSHCGTINKVHHVCCDANKVEYDDEDPEQDSTPSLKPSVVSIIHASFELSQNKVQAGMNILERTRCGKSDADRISNGENARLSEYPWMALLVYTDGIDRTLDCGGSLITERYVLTAAHCIRGVHKTLVSVRLGEHDTKETIDCEGIGTKRKCAPAVQEIDIEEAIYHKDFRPVPRFSNDIALIRLISPARISGSVKPVCLPITERSRSYPVDRMIIAGWGKTENGGQANILQKAVVPLRENKYCDEKLKIIRLIETQLCAGGGDDKIDTCVGDSGGPIFFTVPYRKGIRYVQFGVVSGGSLECGLEFPSIFTRVKQFLPWIAGNLVN